MSIPNSRTKVNAEIIINSDKCNGCGKCITVCKDFSLILDNGKVVKSSTPVFGCFACGQCMAVCPKSAIEILGRELSSDDLILLSKKENLTDYNSLLSLLQHRRSIRDFKDKAVEPELIEKILDAASTAPMGLPPSEVNVLILSSKEKNVEFAKDFSEYLKGLKYMTSNIFLTLMRPFWGKENDEMFRSFLKPLFEVYTNKMDEGNNYITYDAPLAMYFYGSTYCDPADPIVAATYSMIAAESLGLGSCMLGAIHPFIQNGSKAKQFREKHGIKYKSKEGIFVIFGYPEIKYHKGIKRTFASVRYI